MSNTITIRTDDALMRALAVLTADGSSVSQAVRAAVVGAAHAETASALRAEAEGLAADAEDREEMASVLRDMDTLRAW